MAGTGVDRCYLYAVIYYDLLMPISLATNPLRRRRSGVYRAQDKQTNMVSLELNHPSYIHMAYVSVMNIEAERKI